MNGNIIGKKVNLLVPKGVCSWEMGNEVCEIVKVVPLSKELNDWCEHYIVRKADGSEVEIRECDCVFSPDETKTGADKVRQFLRDNDLYADEVFPVSTDGDVICISISWGDWKHEHGWCGDLMRYLGYAKVGEVVTEDDGSDCYSAEHTFIKAY